MVSGMRLELSLRHGRGPELRHAEVAGAFSALKLAGLKFLLVVSVTEMPRSILLSIPSGSTDTVVQRATIRKKGEGSKLR